MMLLYNPYCTVKINNIELGGSMEYQAGTISEPLKIGIDIDHTIDRAPNNAQVAIYNLSPESQAEIEESGLEIEVIAGYKNKQGEYFGTIFKGKTRTCETIMQGRDTVTTVTAGDADDPFSYAKIRETVPAGVNSPLELIEKMLPILEGQGVEIGEIRAEGPPDARATTLDRHIRHELDDIARRYSLHWMIQDNVLNIWPKIEPLLPEPVVILDSETGLVGAPVATEDGINFYCMMLHELRPGLLVEIKANSPRINRELDGLYRLERVNFVGELLGGQWVTSCEARAYAPEVAATPAAQVKPSRNQFVDPWGLNQ